MEKKTVIIIVIVLWLILAASPAPAKWIPYWDAYIAGGNKTSITEIIDVTNLAPDGIEVLKDYSGKPNEFGILKRFELVLPEFVRGCYFSGDHHPEVDWPDGANRTQPWLFSSLEELCSEDYARRPSNYPRVRQGMFLLLELQDGRYLAILPICGPKTMTWLYASLEGQLVLNFGTLGTKAVSCDVPLFAWCYSDDIYQACRKVWSLAIDCKAMAGATDYRMNKKYPEIFKYLGWCSWEEYKWNISEQVLIDTIEQIEKSALPVRYFLVDDGHLDRTDKKLRNFFPDKQKFPNGWGEVLSKRKDDKIKWIGQWNTVSGYWCTVAKDNSLGGIINSHLIENQWLDALVPANDKESCEVFYKAHIGAVKAHGFDFVKVDNQSRNICWYLGGDNAVEAAVNNQRGLEEAVKEYSGGIINCMAHGLPCIFNTKYSAVTRSSIDYKVGKEARGKSHLLQSYSNTLWIGQTVWGDHDMFHSSDKFAGRIMAVSKAMSGAPVYLSDNPKDFVKEYILPLCYEDGELLRPLAPACPLPDSVFIAPMREPKPYRVIAPLRNDSAAIVAYNLFHPTNDIPLTASVTADDYRQAGCMIQPYPGKWDVPAEGLVVYDWHLGRAAKLDDRYEFELKGFADRLLLMSPIRQGWAVIGRTDKYLCPAAVEIISASKDKLKIRLVESGPLAIWNEQGKVFAENVAFENDGTGLWKANIKTTQRDFELAITRN